MLGLQDAGLTDTAAKIGGRTLMAGDFRVDLMEGLANPNTRFTVLLDGLEGANPAEQIGNAVAKGTTLDMLDAGFTNWEITQLWKAGRIPGVTFMEGGSVVPNPFSGAG